MLTSRPAMLHDRRFLGHWVIAAVSVALAACGGSTFDGHLFHAEDVAFRLESVPESWRRVDSEGASLVFRDDSAGASIGVNGRCRKDGDDVPLEALTHHLFLQFTERTVQAQSKFALDGREALHTGLRGKLDGVERRFDVVVLKKDGCVYDFFHVASAASSPESRERFLAFVRGFSAVER